MRQSGILMPVSALPGAYGIGSFSKEAYKFVDWLQKSGQSLWQILPLGPTSYGDSPYQSFSTFAGNPYFIDLDQLAEAGYLEAGELAAADFGADPEYVSYDKIYSERFRILRIAYHNSPYALQVAERWAGYKEETAAFEAFIEKYAAWLPDYALYSAIKNAFGGKSLSDWEDDIRLRRPAAMKAYQAKLEDEVRFYEFQQYLFRQQWSALKQYANEKGIQMIGDVPIYVASDSADAWAHPELFQLDEHGRPSAVAGCPPDGFSATGQLWGNPLYNWPYHKQTGYAWWIRRVRHALGIYDLLRIDHFRGFDTYWAIPAGSPTACTGKWEIGPRMDLFHALEAALGKLPIIAEDLGELFPSVRELLADSTFPGMKVLQFAFGGGDNEYLPHNHVKNSVVYPGTHDNTTLTDWWENAATGKEKANAAAYLHLTPCKPTAKEVAAVKPDAARIALLRAALGSVADRAIIPMPDWLGLGAEAHLNTPGKLGGNWTWRAAEGFDAEPLASRIQAECEVYCRAKEPVEKEAKTSI